MNSEKIVAKDLCEYLKSKNFFFFSSVPCSILKEFLLAVNNDKEIVHIPAVRENIALGLASGAYLAGKQSVVLMQNSGLGNIINTLTSFNLLYKIPALIFITWRGYEGKDAPEHLIMGKTMIEFLDLLKLPYRILSEDFKSDINWAEAQIGKNSIPVFLILKKGLVV